MGDALSTLPSLSLNSRATREEAGTSSQCALRKGYNAWCNRSAPKGFEYYFYVNIACVEALFCFYIHYLLWDVAYARAYKLMPEDILKGSVVSFYLVGSRN